MTKNTPFSQIHVFWSYVRELVRTVILTFIEDVIPTHATGYGHLPTRHLPGSHPESSVPYHRNITHIFHSVATVCSDAQEEGIATKQQPYLLYHMSLCCNVRCSNHKMCRRRRRRQWWCLSSLQCVVAAMMILIITLSVLSTSSHHHHPGTMPWFVVQAAAPNHTERRLLFRSSSSSSSNRKSYTSTIQTSPVVKFHCDTTQEELILLGAPSIEIITTNNDDNQKSGGWWRQLFFPTPTVSYILYFGTEQVSSNNQNPIVTVFNSISGDRIWCRNTFEVAGADGRTIGALYVPKEDLLYLVFTIDGTQGSIEEDFRGYTTNGWITSYGQGGGAKVSVLLRVDRYNGTVMTGTYLKSQLSQGGNTNSLLVQNLYWDARESIVRVQAEAYFLPLSIDGRTPLNLSDCAPDTASPFNYTVTLTPMLDEAITADCRRIDPPLPCDTWLWWKRFLPF
jgi:hypothetical protein